MENYKFTKPKWRIVRNLTYHYSCNDAVYGIITKVENKFEWEARCLYNYGTSRGLSLNLESAKKCIELLIEGTNSTLYTNQIKNENKELEEL